jgi:SAM-dependent methyltransferase
LSDDHESPRTVRDPRVEPSSMAPAAEAVIAVIPEEDDGKIKAKKRPKMTLRIPDDEVARPKSENPKGFSEPPIQAQRIISIGVSEIQGLQLTPAHPGFDQALVSGLEHLDPESTVKISKPFREGDDSWTPYQPTVADSVPPPLFANTLAPAAGSLRPPSRPIFSHEELKPNKDSLTRMHVHVAEPQAPTSALPPVPGVRPVSVAPPPEQRQRMPSVPAIAMVTPSFRPVAPLVPSTQIPFDADETTRSLPDVTTAQVPALANSNFEIPVEEGSLPDDVSGLEVAVRSLAAQDIGLDLLEDESVVSVDVPSAPDAKAPPAPPPTMPRNSGSVPPPPAIPPMRARSQTNPLHSPAVSAPPPLASAPEPTPEVETAKKKQRGWWEELFNEDYMRATPPLSARALQKEVDFIDDSLAMEKGARLLDLACGTGRHAVELAKRGYDVVGLDSSEAMLELARQGAQRTESGVAFNLGDMRELGYEEQFDGVYCWDTSFGYFDDERNAQVVTGVWKALRMGGQFLLDVVNRDYIVRQAPSVAWFEGDRCICMDEMHMDNITSRMRVKRTMILEEGRTREIEYSIRVFSLHELGRMLHEHGFRVAEVSGRIATPGVFFGAESPRVLILAEKR